MNIKLVKIQAYSNGYEIRYRIVEWPYGERIKCCNGYGFKSKENAINYINNNPIFNLVLEQEDDKGFALF